MNVSRRTFLASAALFALVRPNLLLNEELSALAEEPAVESFNRANLSFAQSNDVSFGGFFGTRYKQSLDRLTASPIDNVPFVLDDVNFNQQRRFFNYSGDISGRYIEVASLASTKDKPITPILPQVIDEIVQYQKEDGHFGREVDWNKPIDVAGSTDQSLEMPILWGNGRLMLGLFAAYERFGSEKAFAAAKKMADFYVNVVVPRFCDPNRMDEYEQKAKGYAAAYVTCVFHGIEGLVRAYRLTGEKKYLDAAVHMADFHEHFDTLPVGHSHGSISAHEALVMLYEETNDQKYLDRVVKRWNDAVYQGFVNPSGGVCENYIIEGHSDEGCSEADWLRICLMIWRNTGDVKYLDFAERMLYNEYQMNQWHTGGFGHRYMISDDKGCFAWGERYAESYWCCSYHGPLGYYELKEFFAVGSVCPKTGVDMVYYNFPLEFTTPLTIRGVKWQIASRQTDVSKEFPVRTIVTVAGAKKGGALKFAARIPDWAQKVEIKRKDEVLEATVVNGYAVVDVNSGDELYISYAAVPFLEDRRFHKIATPSESGQVNECVLRFGPNVMASKANDGSKIEDVTLKLDGNGVLQLPDSLTCAYDMSNDERCGKHTFVFNVTVEK
ncbi:MAG: glycoside hydrolase family 127 protein [Thermoguttaceae bacterium]|nr:glycoside hydrolase family 127 protein [Thermoguttaceae bacterium]